MTTEDTELETVLQTSTSVDLDALIAALDESWDVLPEEALRACQAHRELVTPRLIEVLQEAVTLGKRRIVREGNAHLFALFLLAEFEAKEAVQVVIEFFQLPESVLDDLLGDTLTQDGFRLLAVLAGHNLAAIESLVVDRQANQYARWQAASALRQLVVDGRLSREDAVRRLADLMRHSITAEDHWGVTITVDELCYLNPLEVQKEIKSASDRRLVDESIIDWAYFEKRCLHPDQPGRCPQLERFEPSAIADTVEEMRSWYCFSEQCRRDKAEYERRQAEREAQIARQRGNEEWSNDSKWEAESIAIRNEAPRIGRNDPCPCGSGKKYKKCCLRATMDD